MKVKNLKPSESIAAYVERILVIENYQITTPFLLPLFANGSPTLVFTSAKGKIRVSTTSHLTLFGQTIVPETLTMVEDFTLIAYFFKPYSLLSLFQLAAPELTDKPVDLNLVTTRTAKGLQEQLLNAGSTGNMIALLDNYISNLISHTKNQSPVIKYAAGRISNQPTREILLDIQKDLHITERTFQRMFEKYIGIAPNLYRRICQFNSAFQQLNNRKYRKISDIAFENGYADQSHYIRSFKEFTSLTPKEYLHLGSGS